MSARFWEADGSWTVPKKGAHNSMTTAAQTTRIPTKVQVVMPALKPKFARSPIRQLCAQMDLSNSKGRMLYTIFDVIVPTIKAQQRGVQKENTNQRVRLIKAVVGELIRCRRRIPCKESRPNCQLGELISMTRQFLQEVRRGDANALNFFESMQKNWTLCEVIQQWCQEETLLAKTNGCDASDSDSDSDCIPLSRRM